MVSQSWHKRRAHSVAHFFKLVHMKDVFSLCIFILKLARDCQHLEKT